ncbi:MAG TPA: LCP family protein [Anaerolineaceae bacterium]|nr:LCP family protein [Anaerolineaceae bacterium]
MVKTNRAVNRGALLILAICVVLGIVAAFLLYNFTLNFVKNYNITGGAGSIAPSFTYNGPTTAPVAGQTAVPTSAANLIQAPAENETKPWDGVSRVNVLIMGLDYRDYIAGDIPRSDSMIVLTIDPLTMTAGMLSIPRNMWVDIPGFDYNQINTAYFLGAANHLPGGGPVLATKTVEEFLGIPIDYYAEIDFSAFTKFIDDMGGLTIYIHHKITVDPIGGKVTLQKGVQNLPGSLILAYARDRDSTAGGDFDRAARQQEVIMAIRDQTVNLHMLPTLIAQSPKMYNDIASGIHTNLTLEQIIQLALLAEKIPPENIKQGIIGPPKQITLGKSPEGYDVVIPVPDQIRLLTNQIFTASGPLSPAARSSDPLSLIKTEAARIQIQNGTTTPGIASRTADYLKSEGLNIIEQANADGVYSSSNLIIYTGKPYTANALANLFHIPSANIINRYNPDSPYDLTLIVGNDWAQKNPMP